MERTITDWRICGVCHRPRHGQFNVIKVPKPDRAVKIDIFVLSRDWCQHKILCPISVELTN